jgi:hypothetical protein
MRGKVIGRADGGSYSIISFHLENASIEKLPTPLSGFKIVRLIVKA